VTDGDHVAAKRLRRVAVAKSQADDRTLTTLGFIRLPFADLLGERIAARPY
jgi:hypothetical protein